ncbi:unnamed protein product, partial [Allacma fusca]
SPIIFSCSYPPARNASIIEKERAPGHICESHKTNCYLLLSISVIPTPWKCVLVLESQDTTNIVKEEPRKTINRKKYG